MRSAQPRYVLDTSVVIEAFIGLQHRRAAVRRLTSRPWTLIELCVIETFAQLRRCVAQRRLAKSAPQLLEAWADLCRHARGPSASVAYADDVLRTALHVQHPCADLFFAMYASRNGQRVVTIDGGLITKFPETCVHLDDVGALGPLN